MDDDQSGRCEDCGKRKDRVIKRLNCACVLKDGKIHSPKLCDECHQKRSTSSSPVSSGSS